MEIDIENRVSKARELHRSGFNCSQAVVMAYADIFNLNPLLASQISASFGGGIGQMRQTCGAACGMFMLCGMRCGQTEATDLAAKKHNYAEVQKLAQSFKNIHGSIICSELLGLTQPTDKNATITKQPCNITVGNAAQIIGEWLKENCD